MKISQIMKKEPLVLDAGDTLAYAMKMMVEKGQTEALVVKQRKFVGVVSVSKIASLLVKHDIVGRSVAADLKGIGNVAVSSAIERGFAWLKKDDDVLNAFSLLAKRNMNVIPVLDNGKRLLGVVRAADLHREMARLLSDGGKPAAKAKEKDEDFESAKGNTAIDGIVNFVKKNGPVSAEDVAKGCGLTVPEVEEYATSLEKKGFLELEYNMIGKMKLKAPKPK